jgi:hypothetical protein
LVHFEILPGKLQPLFGLFYRDLGRGQPLVALAFCLRVQSERLLMLRGARFDRRSCQRDFLIDRAATLIYL